MNKWEDKPEVVLGNIGEDFVHDYWDKKGFIIYRPVTDRAHTHDQFITTPNKEQIMLADIKTKPARDYKEDTGIDVRHFNIYMALSKKYKMRMALYFIDPGCGWMYGNFLDKLHIKIDKGIIYFPLSNMIPKTKLPNDICDKYAELTTRNMKYKPQSWEEWRIKHIKRFESIMLRNS